jgi:phage-related protein
MAWKIFYYNKKVQEEVFDLTESLLARYIKLTEIMQEYGPDIGMPHTKALGKGLFEMRLKGKEGIARVLYCTIVDKRIYMLHSFIKKTEQIPKKELELAKKRLQEVKSHE